MSDRLPRKKPEYTPFWKNPVVVAHLVAIAGLGGFAGFHIERGQKSRLPKPSGAEITCKSGDSYVNGEVLTRKSRLCDGDSLLISKLRGR